MGTDSFQKNQEAKSSQVKVPTQEFEFPSLEVLKQRYQTLDAKPSHYSVLTANRFANNQPAARRTHSGKLAALEGDRTQPLSGSLAGSLCLIRTAVGQANPCLLNPVPQILNPEP